MNRWKLFSGFCLAEQYGYPFFRQMKDGVRERLHDVSDWASLARFQDPAPMAAVVRGFLGEKLAPAFGHIKKVEEHLGVAHSMNTFFFTKVLREPLDVLRFSMKNKNRGA